MVSDPQIDSAFTAYLDIAEKISKDQCFKSPAARHAWAEVLKSIRTHGGWTNVNDLQVTLEKQKRHKERAEKKRKAAKAKRVKMRQLRRRISNVLAPDVIGAVAIERDRRFAILETVAKLPNAPRWASRLDSDGRNRLANVWAARALLVRQRKTVTGKMVAEFLIQTGKAPNIALNSLVSAVHRDFARIADLENETGGSAIWEEFTFV